jgi:PAS domain S-box-containing protein
MNLSGVKTKTASSESGGVVNAMEHILASGSFAIAIALGFACGFLLWPLAGDRLIAAIVCAGAICIAAMAARQALARQAKVEMLQQRLLDEASYHAFVDSSVQGFFRTTGQGCYLVVNPALAHIYGYDSPEQLQRELTDIGSSLYVDSSRRDEFQRLIAANGTVKDFVSQIRRRDGALIWISENARTVTDEDNQFLFYEGTVEDITAQCEAEEATRRALIETQEAARAKAAFLAAMSHELKTPLNAVIGFSDLMRQELFGPVGEPRYRAYIADVHDNGRRLLGMINDILDLTRIEGNLLDLQDEAVSIQEAIWAAHQAVINDNAESAPVAMQIPADLPLLKADQRRLQQILVHVLSNAVKFTPKAGCIEVVASVKDAGVAIAVKDTGIGMERDRIPHALEPFKQLDSRLARRFEGVGLGLPLANALTRLHQGTLSIESTPGAGTTVTIGFPPERTILTDCA